MRTPHRRCRPRLTLVVQPARPSDHRNVNPASRPWRSAQPLIQGHQGGFEHLGKCYVQCIPAANGVPKLPGTLKERTVVVAISRPCSEVLNCQASQGRVESSPKLLAADQGEDFGVNDVGSGLIRVLCYPHPNCFGPGRINDHLIQARGIEHDHVGQGPRSSSSARSVSLRECSPGRLRVRSSHSDTVGRAARRSTSRRRYSGTLIPDSSARRTRTA